MIRWLFAEKGCGKSVLLQHIFNWAKEKNRDIVCRFFFRNSKSSAHALVCAILHQIFLQRPELLSYAAKLCNGRDIPSVVDEIETSTLFGMFLEIATVSKSDRIVCIIDALDECPTQSREDFIHRLENMFSTHAKDSGVRMLISMRPDPAVARKFGISTIIRYDELVGFEDDIQRMIGEKINHMDLKEHFKDRLRSQLPQRAGHTFLLASLILATISKQRSLRPSDLNRLVRSEKPTDLYENALRSHPAHVRDRAFRLLKIVLVATEALTPGQLDLAECVNAEDCSLETLDREGNPEDALRDICGVLLRVLNGKVFIFHETVREYLFEQDDFNPTGRPANHLLPDAHQILANCCVWFLNLDTWNQVKFHKNIREAIVIARIWFGSRLDDEMSCTDDIMFLKYAATNWFRHFDMSMNIEARLSNLDTTEGDWVLSLPTEGSRKTCDIARPSTALWMMLANMSSSDPGEVARHGSPSLITSFFAFARAPIDPDEVQSIEDLADSIVNYEQSFLWRFLVYQCRAYPQLTQMLFNVACKHEWQVGMKLCQSFSVDLTEALSSTIGSLSTTMLQILLNQGAVVDDRALSQAAERGNAEQMAILLQSCDKSCLIALRPVLQDRLHIALRRGDFEFASALNSFRDVDVDYHQLVNTWMHGYAMSDKPMVGSEELKLYHMFTDHSDGCKSWQVHWRNETYDGLQDFEYSEAALESMLLSSLLWPQHRSHGSRHRAMVQTILKMGAKLTMNDDKLELLFELMCHACWDDEDLVFFLHNIGGFASAISRGRTIEYLITAALRKYYSTCDHILRLISESRQPNLNFLNFQGCSLLGVFISDHEGILDDSNHILEVLRLGADPDFRTSSPRTKSKMIGHVGQEVLKRWRDEDSISLVAMIVAGFVYRKLENDDNVSHGFNPKNLPMCVCSADTSLAPNLIAYRLQYVRLAYLRMSVAKASFDPQPPLALACHKGKWAVAERLLKHNASPSLLWKWYGLTKLFHVDVEALRTKGVCKVDFGDTLLRFLHLLQSFGLLAESINRCEELSGRTLVHFIMLADVRECDEFLNVDGIDLNVRNTDKETPLHWYMYAKGPTIDLTHNPRIRLFTRFDLTIKSPTGSSFLDAIFEGGRNQGSELCFTSVKSSDLCTHGSYFLHKAIRSGPRDWIDFFACLRDFDLNAQDDEGSTVLHLAVILDDVATTLMLLSKGVRTDTLDHQGKAAIHYAILRSCGIVKALIDSERVDLEILNRSRMTPLLEAFAHGAATDIMVTNVRLLVEALIERADSDDWIKPLDFVTNSIAYFERTGEDLPELLKHMQSAWPPVQQDPMYLWNGSDSEDSDGMSSDEEWAEE